MEIINKGEAAVSQDVATMSKLKSEYPVKLSGESSVKYVEHEGVALPKFTSFYPYTGSNLQTLEMINCVTEVQMSLEELENRIFYFERHCFWDISEPKMASPNPYANPVASSRSAADDGYHLTHAHFKFPSPYPFSLTSVTSKANKLKRIGLSESPQRRGVSSRSTGSRPASKTVETPIESADTKPSNRSTYSAVSAGRSDEPLEEEPTNNAMQLLAQIEGNRTRTSHGIQIPTGIRGHRRSTYSHKMRLPIIKKGNGLPTYGKTSIGRGDVVASNGRRHRRTARALPGRPMMMQSIGREKADS